MAVLSRQSKRGRNEEHGFCISASVENKVNARERLPAFITIDFEENVKLFHSIIVDQ